MGRKLFVGVIAPMVAVLLATPASADADDAFHKIINTKYGISIDKDAAVDLGKTACESPIAGIGYYNVLQAMQRRYPEYSLNTIGIVMSAGLLFYCSERLP